VRLQNIQHDSFDVAQRTPAPRSLSMGTFDNKRSER
jgi:hypothetical protein